jgi:hypothetical protein
VRHPTDELLGYVHEELPEQRRAEIAAHIETCAECRAEVAELSSAQTAFTAVLQRQSVPDAVWSRIEEQLAVANREPVQRLKPWWLGWRFALAGAAAATALGVWIGAQQPDQLHVNVPAPSVQVTSNSGRPIIGGSTVGSEGRLAIGQELTTGAGDTATITMDGVGTVKVKPNSRIALIQSNQNEQRLDLKTGSIHAKISAPPKVFFVETPQATAVDLGCEYTLAVDASGNGRLEVKQGWVELQSKFGTTLVPAKADCAIYPGRGPGVPVFKDAVPSCASGVEQFEEGDRSALPRVLKNARREDALTVWHLLSRTEGKDRLLVYIRLSALVPAPPGVTRASILRLDGKALQLWRDQIEPMSDMKFWNLSGIKP